MRAWLRRHAIAPCRQARGVPHFQVCHVNYTILHSRTCTTHNGLCKTTQFTCRKRNVCEVEHDVCAWASSFASVAMAILAWRISWFCVKWYVSVMCVAGWFVGMPGIWTLLNVLPTRTESITAMSVRQYTLCCYNWSWNIAIAFLHVLRTRNAFYMSILSKNGLIAMWMLQFGVLCCNTIPIEIHTYIVRDMFRYIENIKYLNTSIFLHILRINIC